MSRPKKYFHEEKAGRWFPAAKSGGVFFLSCCDCGLRHVFEVHVDANHFVHLRAWRDDPGTGVFRDIKAGRLVRRKGKGNR